MIAAVSGLVVVIPFKISGVRGDKPGTAGCIQRSIKIGGDLVRNHEGSSHTIHSINYTLCDCHRSRQLRILGWFLGFINIDFNEEFHRTTEVFIHLRNLRRCFARRHCREVCLNGSFKGIHK